MGATSLDDRHTRPTDQVFLADDEGVVLGYAMLDRSFFGRPFLCLLFVRAERRRQGVGKTLLSTVLESQTERTFTSTNLSNAPMHQLLKSLGWQACGMVDALDEGDPEVFYFAERPEGGPDRYRDSLPDTKVLREPNLER